MPDPTATASPVIDQDITHQIEFSDPDFGLQLSYPSDWVLERTSLGEHSPPSILLQFSKDNWLFSLHYKYAADITVIGGGLGPGEIQEGGPVNLSGRVIPLNLLVHEGKTKQVWCGFSLDELEVYGRLEAGEGSDYSQIDIDPALQEEVVDILEAMARTEDITQKDGEDVDGWVGILVSADDMPQVDDYFQMLDQNGSRYGIHAVDPVLFEELISYRDTGILIKVWGTLYHGRMDAYNTQIEINRFEEFKE